MVGVTSVNRALTGFPRSENFFGCIFLKQGVMCICYAQMMSAVMMFMLICLLVAAFIDEEQFLKAHYYAASKRLFMASMMYGAPALLLIAFFYALEFVFALRCLLAIRNEEPEGIRHYYLYQIWALSFSLAAFFMTTHWTFNDISNMLFDLGMWGYFIWCIWSLHEVLLIGGDAARLAGFGVTSPGEYSSLLNQHQGGNGGGTVNGEREMHVPPPSNFLPGRQASHFIERL